MTHRVFSRNASSSRAIPVERLIQDVIRDTAMPTHWGKNQPGMQAREECNELIELVCYEHHDTFLDDDDESETCGEYIDSYTKVADQMSREEAWNLARDKAIEMAQAFDEAGYHKQIVNRLLEPFSHINVLVTSTEWENFFELRDHPDAQPEIMLLAQAIKVAMDNYYPTPRQDGEWHLPYIKPEERVAFETELLIKVSVARCARVSYLTHEGKAPDMRKDLDLYDRLVGGVPLHASPAEHQATPIPGVQSGNFRNWHQYRKDLEQCL
jgi:thymidylate synthase ThyX